MFKIGRIGLFISHILRDEHRVKDLVKPGPPELLCLRRFGSVGHCDKRIVALLCPEHFFCMVNEHQMVAQRRLILAVEGLCQRGIDAEHRKEFPEPAH